MEKSRSLSLTGLIQGYKGTLLFEVLILLISLIVTASLFFVFVIPQFHSFIAMNEEVKETRARIATMRSNIQLVSSLNEDTLDSDFLTTTAALPVEKDFSGAMQSILAASVNSGVSLDTFSFTVGTIASKSATPEDLLPMGITIDASGDIASIKDLISSLYTYLPLSVITTADSESGEGESTAITISFPAKPLPELVIDNSKPIVQATPKNIEVLGKLKEWKDKKDLVPIEDIGTSSAELPPPF